MAVTRTYYSLEDQFNWYAEKIRKHHATHLTFYYKVEDLIEAVDVCVMKLDKRESYRTKCLIKHAEDICMRWDIPFNMELMMEEPTQREQNICFHTLIKNKCLQKKFNWGKFEIGWYDSIISNNKEVVDLSSFFDSMTKLLCHDDISGETYPLIGINLRSSWDFTKDEDENEDLY